MKHTINKDGVTYFFHGESPFSNFHQITDGEGPNGGIMFGEHEVFTSEQMFMLSKAEAFCDWETVGLLYKTKTPKECKALGRKVKNYNDSKWGKIRYLYMKYCIKTKCESPSFKKALLESGPKFVEASPYDKIWGAGISMKDVQNGKTSYTGQNLLGKALEEVRNEILNKQ